MATTTSTGAKKIDGTDNWRQIFGIHNDTVDAYDTNISGINTRIDALDPEAPTGFFNDVTFSFADTDWTYDSTNHVWTVTYNNVLLTATSGIEVFYDSTFRSAIAGDIWPTKATGSVTFTTTKAPVENGTLTGTLRIIESVSGVTPLTKGGTGAVTAKGARRNLNAPIKPIKVNLGTVSSLPQTFSDADILEDFVPRNLRMSNPGAAPKGFDFVVADGSVTVTLGTGMTFTGESTIEFDMIDPRLVQDGGSGQSQEQYTGDYVQIGAQTLTTSEKSQARVNIGAASAADVDELSSKIINYDVGTHYYYCVAADSKNNYRRLYIPLSQRISRTVTIDSIIAIGESTELKSYFSLSNESNNGYIQLYSNNQVAISGFAYQVTLTIS